MSGSGGDLFAAQLFYEEFSSDLVQRTGRDFGGSNAQLLGLDENFLVLEAELLGNIVYTNGHISFFRPGLKSQLSCDYKFTMAKPASIKSCCGRLRRLNQLHLAPGCFRTNRFINRRSLLCDLGNASQIRLVRLQ